RILLRPVRRAAGLGQDLRGQFLVLDQQRGGVGQDRRGLAQQRVGTVLGGLLARRVLDHVALVGLEAVVQHGGRERVQLQAQFLAQLLALLAALGVGVALGAALGL